MAEVRLRNVMETRRLKDEKRKARDFDDGVEQAEEEDFGNDKTGLVS